MAAQGYEALTEKEKQTLRLIVRGHDAKSTARHLGLSVHTINERLRDARRKLEVSSSREAARLVFERESVAPENLGDSEIGEAGAVSPVPLESSGAAAFRGRAVTGAIVMSAILAILALSTQPQTTAPDRASQRAQAGAASIVLVNVDKPVRCATVGKIRSLAKGDQRVGETTAGAGAAASSDERIRLRCDSLPTR